MELKQYNIPSRCHEIGQIHLSSCSNWAFGDTFSPWYNSCRLTQFEKEGCCESNDESIGHDPAGWVNFACRWAGMFSHPKVNPANCCRTDGYARTNQNITTDLYTNARLDGYPNHYPYANQHTDTYRYTHASANRYGDPGAADADLYTGTAYANVHTGATDSDLYASAAHADANAQFCFRCGRPEYS
jgi:hypothetical protein